MDFINQLAFTPISEPSPSLHCVEGSKQQGERWEDRRGGIRGWYLVHPVDRGHVDSQQQAELGRQAPMSQQQATREECVCDVKELW